MFYKKLKKKALYSFSNNKNSKNLEETIDIDDISIKIYKKQNINYTPSDANENYIDYLFPPSKTLYGVSINKNINISRINDILPNNKSITCEVLPEKEEYNKI